MLLEKLLFIRGFFIMKDEKRIINVLAQAIYGNRTIINTDDERFDALMLGCLDDKLFKLKSEKINRTIVHLPNSKNVVVVYNKFQEERQLKSNEEYFKETGRKLKPLCAIPEINLEIYSRCFLCRIDENGELQSVEPEDISLVKDYFAW